MVRVRSDLLAYMLESKSCRFLRQAGEVRTAESLGDFRYEMLNETAPIPSAGYLPATEY